MISSPGEVIKRRRAVDGAAADALRHPDLARTFITDTVPPFRIDEELVASCVEILSVAPLSPGPSLRFTKAVRSTRYWKVQTEARSSGAAA